jgi:hypothetical protein
MTKRSGITGNPQAQDRLRAHQRNKEADAAVDLCNVMDTPTGRRFMWSLIDTSAGVFGPSFTPEPLHMAYNEGRRSIGIQLITRCQQHCAGMYLQMLHEQVDAQKADAAVRMDAAATGDDIE